MIMKNKMNTHTPILSSIPRLHLLLLLSLSLSSTSCSSSLLKKPPPLPILPLPSAPQLQWQLGHMAIFLHFGPNTFTDSEWGTGHVDPSVFNPTNLNATQWVQVAKDSGFSRVILTAKHHDGFCLWPTEYTNYSVSSSPWRNGGGDVVGELAKAAKDAGIGLGLYLSPWDRHEQCYGNTLEYNEFYMGQMTELLTRYGNIKEVWLDGAKGEGEKDMDYFFDSWFSLIHQHQPGAVIFSDAGPDTRWVGDEAGVAGSTCWSLFNRSSAKIGDSDFQYSRGGDPFGHDWVPAECDVSIRPAEDIEVLEEFSELRRSIFSQNLAIDAKICASGTRGSANNSWFNPYNVVEEGFHSYWAPEENQSNWVLYFDLQELVSFNILLVEEPIHMGQRVIKFHLEILNENGEWNIVTNGTTVGYRRLLQFPIVKSRNLRFVIDKSRAEPLISYLGIYMDPFSILSNISDSTTSINSSQILPHIDLNHSQIAVL
ncbi:hypothetical protein ACLB2K_031445 [Fragaria x ananassa]